MKTDIRKLVGLIPLALVLEFSRMDECTAKGETNGKVRINFVDALNKEIEQIREGKFPGAIDEALVKTPIMSLMFKYNVEGAHRINRTIKYPELEDAVDTLEKEMKKLLMKHAEETNKIESKMPYKQQYLLEEIIQRVQGWEKFV